MTIRVDYKLIHTTKYGEFVAQRTLVSNNRIEIDHKNGQKYRDLRDENTRRFKAAMGIKG